jgi:NitT/TauT family transport system substrate-binding protein
MGIRRLFAAVGSALMLLSAGTGAVSASETKIRAAVVPCSCFAPYFVADARGYFRQAGIVVEPTQVTSGQDAIAFLANGHIDVLFGAISAGFFNALSRDIKVTIVASMGGESMKGEAPAVPLLIRSDLVENGSVKTLADLKGRSIGFPGGLGSISSFDLMTYLKSSNLTLGDIRIVNIPPPELSVALANRSIDAGIVGSPFSTKIIADGVAKTVVPSIAKIRGRDTYKTAAMFNPDFLRRNGPAVQAFVEALLKGNRDISGEGYGKPENLAILNAATKLEGAALTRDRFYFDDKLDPKVVDLDGIQRAFVEMGAVRNPARLDGVVDDRFVSNARAM